MKECPPGSQLGHKQPLQILNETVRILFLILHNYHVCHHQKYSVFLVPHSLLKADPFRLQSIVVSLNFASKITRLLRTGAVLRTGNRRAVRSSAVKVLECSHVDQVVEKWQQRGQVLSAF